jgi:ABC-2 type transport system permease protein
MTRIWLVAKHHFLFEVRKRTFLIVLFSLPLFLGFSIGMGILAGSLFENNTASVGYVDPGDFLVDASLAANEEGGQAVMQLVGFESAEAAQAALDAEEIDAYYLLAPDFETSRGAELFYYDEVPEGEVRAAFADLIRRNRLAAVSSEVVARVMADPEVTVHAIESGREFGADPQAGDFLPLLVAVIFGFLAMTTSGYMMEVVVTEKENRTMEIVLSSLSTGKLMAGKILGAAGIAALMLLVWIACFVAAVWIGRMAGVGWLLEVQPRWNDVAQIVVVALPAFLFITALFTTFGATMVDSHETQQIGPLTLMVLLIPIYAMPVMVEDPNGPLALALSFFPLTSITAFGLRMLITAIPWWQTLTAAVIGLICFVGMTWLAAKAFHMGMLRYGQRLRLGQLFGRAGKIGAKPLSPATPAGGEHHE